MTPRHLNDGDVRRIALEIFRQETTLQAKLVDEARIRVIAGEIFDNKIEPTRGDIQAIREQVGQFASRLESMETTVGQTKSMLLRLHSFGEVKQPGFFEERAKVDDDRWEKLNSDIQKFGIVREAEKIVTANAIIEAQKKKELSERRATWIRWVGTPAIGIAAASAWRMVQNFAKTGHLPHWISWTLSLWK